MSKSVLFVDDDLCVLQALVRRMRKESFELRTATSGEEGLRILSEAHIDLVVSDMHMKGMLGTEFLAKVAKEYPACFRIMLTGQPSMDVVMNAINKGEVYKFLTKPFDAEQLAVLIRETLQHSDKGHTKTHIPDPPSADNPPESFALSHSRQEPPVADLVVPAAGPSTPNDAVQAFLSRTFIENLGKPGFLESQKRKIRLQQYVVEELIGQGAMGIVLKARDPGLDRHVAIKLLGPSWANSATAHKRFAQEARIAAAVRSEFVVTIFAVSEVSGVPFLVMEYVPGESLQDLLDREERLAWADIARIGREIALGLAAAHEQRLIHRDIKPANILLEAGTRRVRITDFGLARAMDTDLALSQKGLLLGTPQFMSPEQVDGKELTPATDLYSLGSVLYALCTGRVPFGAPTLSRLLHAIAEETAPSILSIHPNVPLRLVQAIEKLHAKNPADRFASAAATAQSLALE
jgi:CheY-like chemotaxis protein